MLFSAGAINLANNIFSWASGSNYSTDVFVLFLQDCSYILIHPKMNFSTMRNGKFYHIRSLTQHPLSGVDWCPPTMNRIHWQATRSGTNALCSNKLFPHDTPQLKLSRESKKLSRILWRLRSFMFYNWSVTYVGFTLSKLVTHPRLWKNILIDAEGCRLETTRFCCRSRFIPHTILLQLCFNLES